ncbi:DinB family protein [Granulicella sp. 5B5]|uniref:DinB family protein n=1 Tax=Granulicella sp. 5B5 TaxID=1617967 RepID=UPI0015F3FBE5|nr:DinB family protein [Granulicella sp. 5B5]QMV17468.1 DinB family protein [Granulicella sp. 5B5]
MTQDEVLIATVIASWKQVTGRVSASLADATEERLDKQVAPGRNRVRYLIGHLTAINDRLFTGLEIGERLHPELDEAYVANPDRKLPDPVSAEELKKAWFDVTEKLTAAFEALTPAQWLERHTAVSAEDFAKEPLRNRLAMLLGRTNHVALHSGQAVLAK